MIVEGRFASPTQTVLPSAPPFGNILSAIACVTITCAGHAPIAPPMLSVGGTIMLGSNVLPALSFKPSASKYFSVAKKMRPGTAAGVSTDSGVGPNSNPIEFHVCGKLLLVVAAITPGSEFRY